MFVLVMAVPALLVVVVGYVIGFAVTDWFCGLLGADATRTPELAGWTTGLVLLGAVTWLLLHRRRRPQDGERHQK